MHYLWLGKDRQPPEAVLHLGRKGGEAGPFSFFLCGITIFRRFGIKGDVPGLLDFLGPLNRDQRWKEQGGGESGFTEKGTFYR